MRYAVTLVACIAVSAILAVAYAAFPRTERVTVQLPRHPTLTALKAALGDVETIDTAVTMVNGQPFRCYKTDSTFSPTREGAIWGMQWCWRTTRRDVAGEQRRFQG
jgi:hypothetical protein